MTNLTISVPTRELSVNLSGPEHLFTLTCVNNFGNILIGASVISKSSYFWNQWMFHTSNSWGGKITFFEASKECVVESYCVQLRVTFVWHRHDSTVDSCQRAGLMQVSIEGLEELSKNTTELMWAQNLRVQLLTPSGSEHSFTLIV